MALRPPSLNARCISKMVSLFSALRAASGDPPGFPKVLVERPTRSLQGTARVSSAVTRCGRFVSYAASTLRTPTYSFLSAAGQSVPSVSTASSGPRGGRQDAIPHPPAHASPCLWVQARQRWSRHAGPAALPWPQEHPAHGQVHRNGARPLQGLLEGLNPSDH